MLRLLGIYGSILLTTRALIQSNHLSRALSLFTHKTRIKQHQATPNDGSSFRELYSNNMPSWLIDKCEELGYVYPTIAQQIALPDIFNGTDCILQSQTGSGKTLAFALPILSRIDASRAAIQAVIIAPTRELGLQISGVLKQLAAGSPNKILIMSIVEGSQNRRQQIWAVAEPPHIVVGNPRPLQKIVDIGRLRLNSVAFVVVDEVDASLISPDTRGELHKLLSRSLSNSFLTSDLVNERESSPLLENLVYSDLARDQRDVSIDAYRSSRQTILCSATVPQKQHFAVNCLKNGWTETLPRVIHVTPSELIPAEIKHEYVECESSLRPACLKYLLTKEIDQWKANKEETIFRTMIFVDDTSASSIDSLIKSAQSVLGNSSVVHLLSSEASLDIRAKIMNDFRDGTCSILICGDGASRGLDIPGIRLIIQMSLPMSIDTYLHRAGRTGRQGLLGKVITMTAPGEEFVVQRLSNELMIEIERRTLKTKKRA